MNIVYIHTHDLGDWISPYGRDVSTPNAAALAGESMLFSCAHAAAPTCSPSRAALLTGQTPHLSGMTGLAHRGFCLRHPERHLANLMRDAGYRTVLSGIQHEFEHSRMPGFPYEHVIGQVHRRHGETHQSFQTRRDREIAEDAVAWIGQHAGERNCFLSVGFFQPHRPLPQAPEAFEVREDAASPFGHPSSPEVKADTRDFRYSVELMDIALGAVVTALKKHGWWEQSIVVFTTDHGIAFPWHKCCLTDRGTRVTLMIRHPMMPRSHGKVCDALVSHLDVYQSLVEWSGLPTPSWSEGHSLEPLMKAEVETVREVVFGEVTFHAAYEPMRSVRSREFKLIRNFLTDLPCVLPNVDDSPSKDACLSPDGLQSLPEEWALFDLRADPDETNNVAGDPRYAEVESEMRDQLEQWMRQTDDPLLQGHPSRPPGARVNARSATCPGDQPIPEDEQHW